MSFILLGILNSQAAGAGEAGAMELIESNILTASASSVTFSSIPQDYKHLQIRYTVRNTTISAQMRVQLNGDTGANYASHALFGNGSSVFSSNDPFFRTFMETTTVANDSQNTTGNFTAGIMDFLDYAATNKNTTMRLFAGVTQTDRVELRSNLRVDTSAVSSILLFADTGSFITGCRFSLYGIRG